MNYRMTRLHLPPLATLALSVLFTLSGCSSDHATTLLESDVPAPPSMDVRYSFDIVRDAGELRGGRFVLAGEVPDLRVAADETIARYSTEGWTLQNSTVLPAQATLVFSKGQRTVHVEIAKRRIDPRMSSAIVRIERTG